MAEKTKSRIEQKIEDIEDFLLKLEGVVPEGLEEYESDYKVKWSCERGFGMIVEAVTDLAFLIITENKFAAPDDDFSSFDILVNNEIISESLAEKLKEARGMRNFIAHRYGEIDDSKVFHAVSEELQKDVGEFLDAVRRGR